MEGSKVMGKFLLFGALEVSYDGLQNDNIRLFNQVSVKR